MSSDLIRSVLRGGVAGLGALAPIGALVGGTDAGLGVLAGGILALGNLWLLGRASERTLALFVGRRLHPLWMVSVGLRHLAIFGALALLLASGRAHPLALIAGLSVLPPVLVIAAFRAARSS